LRVYSCALPSSFRYSTERKGNGVKSVKIGGFLLFCGALFIQMKIGAYGILVTARTQGSDSSGDGQTLQGFRDGERPSPSDDERRLPPKHSRFM
ncbi:unnamed protein product, partial [Ectocarpus sp. 8 AP-2014]